MFQILIVRGKKTESVAVSAGRGYRVLRVLAGSGDRQSSQTGRIRYYY